MSYIIEYTKINGVLDPSASVLDNIELIAKSAQAYVSWDPVDGVWVANVNKPDTTDSNLLEWQFTDDNIIGSINLVGSGINDAYNAAKATYNEPRLLGKKDEVKIFLDTEDRYTNELDNELSLNYQLLNDPGQVAYAAAVEMKQSRVDRIIEFKSDYTALGLKAGTIIGVSNELYFPGTTSTPKKFRVIAIEEIDDEDGAIIVSITAIEYDGGVYGIEGFEVEERNTNSGILSKENNLCIQEKEREAIAEDVSDAIENDDTISDKLIQKGVMISAASATFNATCSASSSKSDLKSLNIISFTPSYTGTYQLQAIIDQNSSGAVGGRGSNFSENDDHIAVYSQVSDGSTFLSNLGTGGTGAFGWTDFVLADEFTLTAGTNYYIEFFAVCYTESNPTTGGDFDISFNIFTVGN